MDKVREQLKNPLVTGVAGLVVGLLLGWFVIGWGIWPVKWTDTSPSDLTFSNKVTFMRMAVEAYARNVDQNKAILRYELVGKDASKALDEVAKYPGGLPPEVILSFRAAVISKAPASATPGAGTSLAPTTVPGAVVSPTKAATTPPKAKSLFSKVLPILCVVVLLVAAAVILYFLLRKRAGGAAPTPAMQAQQAAKQAGWTDYQAEGVEPPMAQFMASYKLGDDLFDDSFSIDSPAGEFLGECGVSISETIGVGEPKKVTALEVWLFDKNDIQTVTKVLMSNHAYSDETTRQRLAAKGEPILTQPGAETVLETQTLQLVARVVDMGYGEGALPTESFFERFILELAVWPKA